MYLHSLVFFSISYGTASEGFCQPLSRSQIRLNSGLDPSICTATDKPSYQQRTSFTTPSPWSNCLFSWLFLFRLLSQMTSFASLMALSATHTKESQRVVADALQARREKEAFERDKRAKREAKEREEEKKLLLKRLEDQRRAEERLQRLEVEQQAKQQALERREKEQRDALRFGPKKAAKLAGKQPGDSPNWPSSSSSNREAVHKPRVPDNDSGSALTREEIRERKLQAELRKTYATAKRSTATGGYSKHGKKLPGGAFDIQSSGATVELAAGQTVKERLTSLPITLKVLGGKNKDRRSELEILQDSKKKRSGQVLEGDEARNFDGYFAPTKKEKERLKQAQASSASATTSGADSPGPREYFLTPTFSDRDFCFGTGLVERSSSSVPTFLKEPSSSKPVAAAANKQSQGTSAHQRNTSKQATPSASKATIPKINKVANTSSTQRHSSVPHSRPKRPRSPSLSESPPPKRRNVESDISSAIWKIFGKDRQQYTSRDVFSDDEDMEADATVLEKEEAYRLVLSLFWLLLFLYFKSH